jgi:MFS transporter, DHA1 family, multidrug resistance protein
LVLAMLGIFNLYALLIPWAVLFLAYGIAFANCVASALMPFKEIAGAASAIIGCVQIFGGIIISSVVSKLHEKTQLPLSVVVMVASIMIFLSLTFLAKENKTTV